MNQLIHQVQCLLNYPTQCYGRLTDMRNLTVNQQPGSIHIADLHHLKGLMSGPLPKQVKLSIKITQQDNILTRYYLIFIAYY